MISVNLFLRAHFLAGGRAAAPLVCIRSLLQIFNSLLLIRGKNCHFPTCHHPCPASSASCLPSSQPQAALQLQGQPPSLNLENKVPLSLPVGKGRGSFSHLETLNCRSRLFPGRKMLNVVQKDETQYLLSSVSKSYRVRVCLELQ